MPGVFLTTQTNPTSTAAGSFGTQLLTAMLNQRFSATLNDLSRLSFSTLCDLVDPIIHGLTVPEVIFIANQVISGTTAVVYPGFTPSILTEALALYNEAFDGCNNSMAVRCFDCGISLREQLPELRQITVHTPTTVANVGVMVGVNVFIVVIVLAMVVLIIVVWYSMRNQRAQYAKNSRFP